MNRRRVYAVFWYQFAPHHVFLLLGYDFRAQIKIQVAGPSAVLSVIIENKDCFHASLAISQRMQKAVVCGKKQFRAWLSAGYKFSSPEICASQESPLDNRQFFPLLYINGGSNRVNVGFLNNSQKFVCKLLPRILAPSLKFSESWPKFLRVKLAHASARDHLTPSPRQACPSLLAAHVSSDHTAIIVLAALVKKHLQHAVRLSWRPIRNGRKPPKSRPTYRLLIIAWHCSRLSAYLLSMDTSHSFNRFTHPLLAGLRPPLAPAEYLRYKLAYNPLGRSAMASLSEYMARYDHEHTNVWNKVCHGIGIPLVIAGIVLLLMLHWQIGLALFILGWIFLFGGHR